MNRVLITLGLVALSGIALAQRAFPAFQVKTVNIGATPAGDSIRASYIDLSPFTVTGYKYDSAAQLLYLDLVFTEINGRLENRNYYTCFDLKQKKVVWNSSFKHYSPSAHFMGNNIARHMAGFCGVYDAQTRELLGKDPEDWIVYTDNKHRFFLSQNGLALDGETLDELWDADIKAKYGWSELRYIGADTLLIIAGGIYAIDIKTGKGWRHELKTGADKYGNMIALNAIGLTAAMFTGVGVYGGSPDKVSGMHSALLDEADGWYLAGANAMIRVRKNGELAWKVELPENHTGQSKIWKQGDSVFVLNKGYAYKGDKVISVDKPYLSAYNAGDGKLLYHKAIHDRGIVNNAMVRNNSLYLRFDKYVSVYDIRSGHAVQEVLTADSMERYNVWVDGADISIEHNDGAIKPYDDVSRQEVLLQNSSNGDIMVLNNKLNLAGTKTWGEYYVTAERYGYTFQAAKSGTKVYKDLVQKADLKTGYFPSFSYGDEFVVVDDDKLYFYTMPR